MYWKRLRRQRAGAGLGMLVAALAAEFADELVDGTRGAALPLMRHDLGLTYVDIGLLTAVPLVVGSLAELPLGILAGYGTRRHRAVLAGGAAFVASLAAVAAARSFPVLLLAFTAFFPASGAFVSLTQATLMDAAPARRERHMALWTVAGSAGGLAGPLLMLAVLAGGGGWREAFVILAAGSAAAVAGVARTSPGRPAGDGGPQQEPDRARARDVLAALRSGEAVRWLALLQLSDLLTDVLIGFLAVYLVDVAHASSGWAAAGIALHLGAGLASETALVPVLSRVPGRAVLSASAAVAAAAYPAFLLTPGLAAKLAIMAVLSIATATWYPLLTAQLYGSLPGQSGVAVTLSSAAALAGGAGPLLLGLLAAHVGLTGALACLTAVPMAMLAGLSGPRARCRGRPATGAAASRPGGQRRTGPPGP